METFGKESRYKQIIRKRLNGSGTPLAPPGPDHFPPNCMEPAVRLGPAAPSPWVRVRFVYFSRLSRPHCIHVPHLLRPPTHGGARGCFHASATVDNAAVSTGGQASLQISVLGFFFSDKPPEVESLSHEA